VKGYKYFTDLDDFKTYIETHYNNAEVETESNQPPIETTTATDFSNEVKLDYQGKNLSDYVRGHLAASQIFAFLSCNFFVDMI